MFSTAQSAWWSLLWNWDCTSAPLNSLRVSGLGDQSQEEIVIISAMECVSL